MKFSISAKRQQNGFCPCIQAEDIKYLLVIVADLKGRLLSIFAHGMMQNV
jgi:hypothetical protein